MLYVTTRNNQVTFPPRKVLGQSRGEDGGLYLPYRSPMFSPAQIEALGEKSFGQCVSDVLNLLFETQLTGWDVDFAIGRYPVRLVNLRHRVCMAECWHNPDWSYDRMAHNLAKLLGSGAQLPGNWCSIGIRIAVLFGIFSELKRSGIHQADVSVVAGDCAGPAGAWYARAWGLPIGNIICCCNENKPLWDLMVHGQMRTDCIALTTPVGSADVTRLTELERLLYEFGGVEEAVRYADACRSGSVYIAGEQTLGSLRQGQYVSVVSTQRLNQIIPGAYTTHQYLHSPGSALAYAGLQDYRAKTGQTRPAVILAENSPGLDAAFVAETMGISREELEEYM